MSVVVITGAGQGQGAAEARLLAAQGVTVIAVDRAENPAETTPGAEYRQLDVTDETGWAALRKELAERFGRVDGLVANAGITWRARLLDVTPADLQRVQEVNVTGALLAIQATAPLMTGGDGTTIVGTDVNAAIPCTPSPVPSRSGASAHRKTSCPAPARHTRKAPSCSSTFPAITSGTLVWSPPSTAAG